MTTVRTMARQPAGRQSWLVATVLLIVAHIVLVFALYRDYGITYDERWHVGHGENLLSWYSSGFTDRSFETYGNLRLYGGLFDLMAAVLHPATGMDVYQFRHVLNGLFAALALAGVARLGARLGGPATAFFAVLLLLSTPRFFGHGFNNCKDIPFAACFVWAMSALVALVQGLPRPGWRRVVSLGAWLGLALATRMSSILIVGCLALGIVLWLLLRWRHDEFADGRTIWRTIGALGAVVAGVGVVSWLVMMPFWPYLQLDPLRHLILAVLELSKAGRGTITVLYGGEMLPHHDLPRDYIWSWLARSLPETYGLGLLLALLAAVVAWRRREASGGRAIPWVLVSAATFSPLIVATLTRPPVYDGIRHFLFVVCLLAVVAGAGFASLLRPDVPVAARVIPAALLVIGTVQNTRDMIRLHPYQAAWFNRMVGGGLQGADGRYDTDYWGNAFKEGAEWLTAHVPTDGAQPTVASSCYPTQASHYLPPDLLCYVGSVDHSPPLSVYPYADPPDYYLATTRWNRHQLYPGEIIHRVERDSVTLLVVVRVDRESARELVGSGVTFHPPRPPE